jgi:thioester reductase-like protein
MKYTFLTGATGLLGAYLLRDGMSAGQHFAVLARSSLTESARSRIETILARFEREWKQPLPRPVVIEGDLSQPGLGMSREDFLWVKSHCDRILHNAASLVFYLDKDGEPYRSNIEGTHHVLTLAEETGIRVFHHVSTAYVCGLRTDRCLEQELDMGQKSGNDYEKSKIEAEKTVRAAAFLDSVTVYRPAIIIGDSETGYTSTYHGFFTPLKIAGAITVSSGIGVVDGTPLMHALGLTGNERKNFVPVDWVSAVMTHIMTHREHWGKTYHLVPGNRVSVQTVTKVFEGAIKRFYAGRDWSNVLPQVLQNKNNWQQSQEIFRNQMGVYQSYWRDDPVFDDTNVRTVAPHLPCPPVQYARLMRMAVFALENGFGWPKPGPIPPPVELDGRLKSLIRQDAVPVSPKMLGLQINGQGGGEWTIRVNGDGNGLLTVLPWLPVTQIPQLYMNHETYLRLNRKQMTPGEALSCGAVLVELFSGTDAGSRGISSGFTENLLDTLTNSPL